MKDDNQDYFILSNCTKKSLIRFFAIPEEKREMFSNCKNILTISKKRTNFKFGKKKEEFEEKKEHRHIHLIAVDEEGDQLIWKKSSGKLDNIREYIEQNTSINEQDFHKIENRVIIISGEPGIGKSTTLCHISNKIESSWVIIKNLKDFHPIIDPCSQLDISVVVSYLLNEDCDNIFSTLLKLCLIEDDAIPVVLIFDGFDEIKEESLKNKKIEHNNKSTQEYVIDLLKFLNDHTKARIWITSRTFQNRILEKQFTTFATKFKHVEENEIKDFLGKIWMARLRVELNDADTTEKILEQYIDKLFDHAKLLLEEEITKLMGVPLQMQMVAEVAQPQTELFTESIIVSSAVPQKIDNIYDLYKCFIEVKYDIYLQGKSGLACGLTETTKCWLIEVLNKKHRSLSFQLLFPDAANEFLGTKQVQLNQKYRSDEEIELNRVGLIQSSSNGEFDFIHRTFAVFFVAELLVSWLSKFHGRHQKYPGIEAFLVSKILLQSDYKVIRLFMNYYLSLHDLPQEALSFYVQYFTKLWIEHNDYFFNKKHETILHVVSTENCGALVKFVINILNNANLRESHCSFVSALITTRDKHGRTALYKASKYSCDDTIATFLDFLKFSSQGLQKKVLFSSIFRTCGDQDDPHIQYLLSQITADGNASIISICADIQNKWELIPDFINAAISNDVCEVQRLVNDNLDQDSRLYLLTCTDEVGTTALQYACKYGAIKVVDYLLNEKVHLEGVHTGYHAMCDAAFAGHDSVVFALLKHGVNVNMNFTDGFNLSPLHMAVISGHNHIVNILLHSKADISARDWIGCTALHWAAHYNQSEIVETLLDFVADANCRDKESRTPMHVAAYKGNTAILKQLLEKRADIEAKDMYNCTPLRRAELFGQHEAASLLIERGAVVQPKQGYKVKADFYLKKKIRCSILPDLWFPSPSINSPSEG